MKTPDEIKKPLEPTDEERKAAKWDEWISVKERLPEKKQRVMVYTTQGAYRLGAFLFVGKAGAVWFQCDKSCISCTHWMLLPEPPNRMVKL